MLSRKQNSFSASSPSRPNFSSTLIAEQCLRLTSTKLRNETFLHVKGAPHETIIGVVNEEAKAYPLTKLTPQSPVLLDSVGEQPILLVVGPDGKSVRVFSRKVGTSTLDFYGSSLANADNPWSLLDETTSVSGALTVARFRAG